MSRDETGDSNTASPTVSVILPTYNRAQRLPTAIESVLDQTYEDLELIVVDDGSTDETGDVVSAISDDRLRYVAFEENRGANVARNAGIDAARGKYIAFQDSDDVWYPGKLAKQVSVLENADEDVGVAYTGCWQVWDDGREYLPARDRSKRAGDIHHELLAGNFVTTPVTLVRRRCFEMAGRFDERLPRLQDWEFWLRVSQHLRFELIDEPLAEKDVESDDVSISSDLDSLVTARDVILRKHRDKFEARPEALAALRFRLGHGFLLNGRATDGKEHVVAAARTDPRALWLFAAAVALLGPGSYRAVFRLYRAVRPVIGGSTTRSTGRADRR